MLLMKHSSPKWCIKINLRFMKLVRKSKTQTLFQIIRPCWTLSLWNFCIVIEYITRKQKVDENSEISFFWTNDVWQLCNHSFLWKLIAFWIIYNTFRILKVLHNFCSTDNIIRCNIIKTIASYALKWDMKKFGDIVLFSGKVICCWW